MSYLSFNEGLLSSIKSLFSTTDDDVLNALDHFQYGAYCICPLKEKVDKCFTQNIYHAMNDYMLKEHRKEVIKYNGKGLSISDEIKFPKPVWDNIKKDKLSVYVLNVPKKVDGVLVPDFMNYYICIRYDGFSVEQVCSAKHLNYTKE